MPDYRRIKEPGGTYFFTVVTYNREEFLCEPFTRETLSAVFQQARKTYPFNTEAWVLLPDHIHCIWTLPPNDHEYSKRWSMIKSKVTQKLMSSRQSTSTKNQNSSTRSKRRERTVWQRRFWEHWIQNQDDFNRHCDYIHYNPVKHGYAKEPSEWPYSSFHHFVSHEIYPENWGVNVPNIIKRMNLD